MDFVNYIYLRETSLTTTTVTAHKTQGIKQHYKTPG